ncbi:hypothetical protein Tco_1422302, partial [Tanacetum coccineum]
MNPQETLQAVAHDEKTILNICPSVEGKDITDVPDDETTLTLLLDLGYKGLLNRHTNIFVDHMHHPWRTLAAIINKCLSGKTASNDTLRKKEKRSRQSKPKPKPAKKKTASKRVVKKKVTMSADDNIISDDPDATLELVKSISQTKAEEAEVARKVHATHARIVTESAKKKFGGRSSKSVVIEDTLSAPKSKTATSEAKLKGALYLTPIEQEATNIMQALKERVLDEDKDITEEKVILEWEDEQDSEHSDDDEKDGDADDEHVSDKQDDDDEDDQTESDEDDIYKYKIR